MRIAFLTIFFLAGIALSSVAQVKPICDSIMMRADSAIMDSNYTLALARLRAYKICNPDMAAKADDKIAEVVNLIRAQRDSANKEREAADQQRRRAQAAQAVAERQAYLAQLSAMSSNLLLLAKKDPTVAFWLAWLAYNGDPNKQNNAILRTLASDTNSMFFENRWHDLGLDAVYDDSRQCLYVASSNGGIREYDRANRLLKSVAFNDFGGWIAVSPDARFTARSVAGRLTLYRNGTNSYRETELPRQLFKIKWTTDGKYLLVTTRSDQILLLDSGLNIVHELKSRGTIYDADASMEAGLIFVANYDRVRIYNMDSLPTQEDSVNERAASLLSCSGDGTRFYTVRTGDSVVKAWEGEDPKPVCVFAGHRAGISTLQVSAVTNRVLASFPDGGATLWEADGKVVSEVKTSASVIIGAFFSSAGTKITTSADENICLWNPHVNLLGTIAASYRGKKVIDMVNGERIISEGTTWAPTVWVDSTRILKLDDDAMPTLVDGEGAVVLQKFDGTVQFTDRNSGRDTVLSKRNDDAGLSVNSTGDILVWADTSLLYFNKKGDLVGKKVIRGTIVDAGCINPVDKNVLYVAEQKIWLVKPSSGYHPVEWAKIPEDISFISHMEYSPETKSLICWQNKQAYLFDEARHVVRNFELTGHIYNVRFSRTGDSLWFFTDSGVEVRYALTAIVHSKQIGGLTYLDKLKYGVPGVVQDVVKKADWRGAFECVDYFLDDYWHKEERADLDELSWLWEHFPGTPPVDTDEYRKRLEIEIPHVWGYVGASGNEMKAVQEKMLARMKSDLQRLRRR
ncbi:MAG TPA: hypothetical protein VNS58_09165 [Puia sp.]|nr:hypothetical protein [Puia sp.]